MMEEGWNDEDIAYDPLLSSTYAVNCNPSEDLTLSSAMKYRDSENMSKNRILKNVIVLGTSMFLFFFSYQSLANLQSTMNSVKGIGMESQSVIYASAMISCLLLPDFLIKTFGCKRTVVAMIVGSIPFLASNYHPSWNFIIPSSVLMGIVFGPLGTSFLFYVTEMAIRYQRVSNQESLETVLARFSGFISFFLENTQIWGNFISYRVLNPGMIPIMNETNISCGINFKVDQSNPNLQPPPEDQRYLLVSIYVMAAVIAAFLMGLFTDKLDNDIESSRSGEKCRTIIDRLMAALKQNCKLHQILILPITTFTGIELAFYASDFTQAFIACSWGVHHVGFVTICFGVCGAIMALAVGPLVKCISQMAVLLLAGVANLVCCILLFFWQPSPDAVAAYFIFAGVWGMGDAIWWSQVTALYGLMFPNDREAAFSNLYFWSFLGFFISYSYANYLTVVAKIYILLGFLITGMLGYLTGQFMLRCTAKREYVRIGSDES